MRDGTRRLCAAAGLVLGLACAGSAPEPAVRQAEAPAPREPAAPPEPVALPEPTPPTAPARLSVEVLRGTPGTFVADLAPPPVVAVIDLGASLDAPAGAPSPRAAVRAAADRHLRALRSTPVTAVVLGQGRDGCVPPRVLEARGPALAGRVASLLGGAVSPLAAGLDAAAERLERLGPDRGPGARVVVFSDFEPVCPGDPCAAGARLLALGAELDLVTTDAAPPACLAALRPPASAPPGLDLAPAAVPVAFRVERPALERDEAGRRPFVPHARGRAGAPPLSLPPGAARVAVELDPESRVGPIGLPAGGHTRVRVLDFPAVGVRQIFVARDGTPPPARGRR